VIETAVSRPVMETLFEDDEIVVRAQPGAPGNPTLLTFGDYARRPEEAGFWASVPAARMGWPAIGFVARRPNWFPAASVHAAAAAVRARLGPVAIGYGYSMGGYAVLKYGGLLGLTHALAVSPQASISRSDLPRDPRHHHHHDPALHADMLVRAKDPSPVAWMLADASHPADLQNVRLLEAAGVRLIHAPHMNHNPILLLIGRVAMEAALRAVLAEDLTGLRRLLRQRRRELPVWYAGLGATLLARGRIAPGTALLERAHALGLTPFYEAEALSEALNAAPGHNPALLDRMLALPDLPAASFLTLSVALGTAGRREESRRAAQAGLAAHPPQAGLLTHLGHLLLGEQRTQEAAAALEQAVSLDPGEGWAWVGLSIARLWGGNAMEADVAARAAVAKRPADPHAWFALGEALFALGRQDEAGEAYAASLSFGAGEAAWIGLLRVRFAQGRMGLAAAALRQAMAAHPDSTELPRMARAHPRFLISRPWLLWELRGKG
jgi:tetratricopeptide (TPR) repeat protein